MLITSIGNRLFKNIIVIYETQYVIYNMLMETDTIGILIDFFIYELNNLVSLKAIYLHDGEYTEKIRITRRC